MDDRHAARLGHAIAEHDPPAGRPARVAHALEFEAGEDVGEAAVAVLLDPARVERLEPRGQDDVADLDGRPPPVSGRSRSRPVGQSFSHALHVPRSK